MKAGKEHPFTEAEMKLLLLVGNRNNTAKIAKTLGIKLSSVYSLQRNLNIKYETRKIYLLVCLALEKRWILLDREA